MSNDIPMTSLPIECVLPGELYKTSVISTFTYKKITDEEARKQHSGLSPFPQGVWGVLVKTEAGRQSLLGNAYHVNSEQIVHVFVTSLRAPEPPPDVELPEGDWDLL